MVRRKIFSSQDAFIAAGLLLALFAVHFLVVRGEGAVGAEICLDGRTVAELSLIEDRNFIPKNLPGVEIAVRKNAVGFVRSDCPDKLCLHAGFLSTPGQVAVCLPNRVVLRVVAHAAGTEAPDSTTY